MGDRPRSILIRNLLYDLRKAILSSNDNLFPIVVCLDGLILSNHSIQDEVIGHTIALAYCAAQSLAESYGLADVDHLCIRCMENNIVIVPINEDAILVSVIDDNFDNILLKMKQVAPKIARFVY